MKKFLMLLRIYEHLPSINMKFLWLLFGVWLPLSAMAAPGSGADRFPRVLESFEVGDSVYVRALTVEPERDAIWVGTSSGVHEIDLKTYTPRNTFTRADGLANEYVFAIGIDQQGYKWFGTNAGGVSRYKDGKWKTFFPTHGLADYWVYSFASEQDGDLWIGTWAGANRVSLDDLTFETYVKQLINEWVYGLAVDGQDRVWFGTEGGVTMFDGQKWRSWSHQDGIGGPNQSGFAPSLNTGLGTRTRHDLTVLSQSGEPTYNPGYVFAMHVAPDQSIWAGTWGGGVSRYDGKRWQSYTSADGLAGDIVYSIDQDSQGVLWFGTNQGVSRFDGRNWRTYDKSNGLLENDVYAIAVLPNDEVWAGTRRGVTRIGVQRD